MESLPHFQSKAARLDTRFPRSSVTVARLTEQESWLSVVPDSEEDRRKIFNSDEVIEISSDEEDNLTGKEDFALDNSFLLGTCPRNQGANKDAKPPVIHEFPLTPSRSETTATPRKLYRAPRRVIESSGSEDSDGQGDIRHASSSEIIELSDSSLEQTDVRDTEPLCGKMTVKAPVSSEDELLNSHRENGVVTDNSLLILDVPRSARKPLRLSNLPKASSVSLKRLPDLTNDSEQLPLDGDYVDPKWVSRRTKALDPPLTPITPKTATKTPLPRSKGKLHLSKKAQAAAEQERRVIYAQKLFEELNRSVFEEKLPKETKLNWSKRLLTTAGRAKWHRSRDGVQTTEIELAEKILDCDERIRNTLSHEMCHLASWIIDASPKEVHGSIFKSWSNKVMRAHPEIEITTRHNYEIGFKFNWKCLQCSKIYGRHSKSIDVNKVVCGACREGKLIALFETRTSRNPKTPKTSKLAAAKPQDSPRSLPPSIDEAMASKPNISTDRVVYVIHDSDSEQDDGIETLTTAMGSVTFIG